MHLCRILLVGWFNWKASYIRVDSSRPHQKADMNELFVRVRSKLVWFKKPRVKKFKGIHSLLKDTDSGSSNLISNVIEIFWPKVNPLFQKGILEAFTFRKNHRNYGTVFFETSGRHLKMPYRWLQLMSAERVWFFQYILRIYWDLRLSELFIFSKIHNFDRWRIGLKGFPGVTGSNHCNVLFNGLGEISRGSILSESSKNVMGSSFDPRSHMRLHLLRFQICSFWHAITLGSSLCGQPKELFRNWDYEVYIKINIRIG